MEGLDSFLLYARSYLRVPYLYGGNCPLNGVDCSALLLILLRKAGLVGIKEDLTAQGIYEKIKVKGQAWGAGEGLSFPKGTILFYGQSKRDIDHTALVIDSYSVIEAGGGDSSCLSLADAIRLNAFVRERAINLRLDIVAGILPNYPWQTHR